MSLFSAVGKFKTKSHKLWQREIGDDNNFLNNSENMIALRVCVCVCSAW